MWIVFKVFISVQVFLLRISFRYFFTTVEKKEYQIDQIICYESVPTNWSRYGNTPDRTHFDVKFKSNLFFKITPETKGDKFFKKIGFSKEIQTGDEVFDRDVYIASDSPSFLDELIRNKSLRDLILKMFAEGCVHICSNGSTIRAIYSGDKRGQMIQLSQLAQIYQHVTPLARQRINSFKDPFVLKALVIEGVIWSLACYGVIGIFKWVVHQKDLFLYPNSLYVDGLILGCGLAIVLILTIILLLRGSSRGHRIIVESTIVLLLAFPLGGTSLVIDINSLNGNRDDYKVNTSVLDLFITKKRTKRMTVTNYNLSIDKLDIPDGTKFPDSIVISEDLYKSLELGQKIELVIDRGYLKHPWIKSIQERF